MAQLDALFMRLYGPDRIGRAADETAFGHYRTRELVLGYMNALAAGDIDTVLAI